MKQLLGLLICLITSGAFSQTKFTDTITSKKLGQDREITIALPPSYERNTEKKYPLLLLLDGDYLLDPFLGNLNYGAYWDDIPEMVIVAITQNKNNEREADSKFGEQGVPEETGASFFEFVGMELLPAIEKTYRIAPFKIIAGHDTTAGFVNFFLYKENPLFNAYISMSPELPPGMEEQIPQRLAAIGQPIFYYHSTADGDLKKMRERIKALDAAVKSNKKPTLNYGFDDFTHASHYSLVLHSIPNALYQFFAVYQPISTTEFSEKIAVLPSGYVDYLVTKYDFMEKALGIKLQIRVSDFKAIEAAILKNKAYSEFDKLADLAKKNYPKSMLADYHMGMMYEKMGETNKAIKAYMSGFQREEIGDLTKDFILEKAEDLK
ncbi:MAG TPA: alpha/beta hydrolase-fold protein [Flavobacterium sp.]|jgi:hypothetical protein